MDFLERDEECDPNIPKLPDLIKRDPNIPKLTGLITQCMLKCYKDTLESIGCKTSCFINKDTKVKIICNCLKMFGEKCTEKDYTDMGEEFKEASVWVRLNSILYLMGEAKGLSLKVQYASVVNLFYHYIQDIMKPWFSCEQRFSFVDFDKQVDAIIESPYLKEIVELLLSQEQKSEEQKSEEQKSNEQKKKEKEKEKEKEDEEEKEYRNGIMRRRKYY